MGPALRLLQEETPLCPECRGRVFGRLGHGLSNPERYETIRRTLEGKGPVREPSLPEECRVCHGAFARIPVWVERVLKAADGWEWRTFRCGSRWPPESLAQEEAIWYRVGSSWGESVRSAFNRELGKALARASGRVGAPEPTDLVFVTDLQTGLVERTVTPLFYRGRYRKLDRTLPQTQWPCRRCRGKGCTACQGTGKTYDISVEELIGGPLKELLQGSAHAFHGMGREDIDARMLGRGRPFVVEIREPRRRTLDLELATRRIQEIAAGRVEVLDLSQAQRADVERVKAARPDKTYRVTVQGDVPEEKVKEVLPLLVGRSLAQRTPSRVAHRRADLVRHRTIREVRWMGSEGTEFTLEVRAEAGTYIKELIQGDEGRTSPNLSELLGHSLKVQSLDVLEIHDE